MIHTVDYCPSEASRVYDQYVSFLNESPNVFIDFKKQSISAADSNVIFGRLLIWDARRSVLCKNIDTSKDNVTRLFEGVNESFRSRFPDGIKSILEPQIELYDPYGEGNVYVVKLGRDAYEAVSQATLDRNRNRR